MAEATVIFPDPKEPSQVGQIEFDVLVEHEVNLSSEVTENPVEDGSPIHDHIINQAPKLRMVVALALAPVTWYERHGSDPGRIDDAAAKLEEIWNARTPVTVATHSKIYEDMVITDLSIPRKQQDKKVLNVPIEFTKIRKVQVKTTQLPEALSGRGGETEAEAGTAEQKPVTDEPTKEKSKSILKGWGG